MDTDDFYKRHRGGVGNVVVVFVFADNWFDSAVFSCVEKARQWAEDHEADGNCVIAPYVVDDPEYGDREGSMLQ